MNFCELRSVLPLNHDIVNSFCKNYSRGPFYLYLGALFTPTILNWGNFPQIKKKTFELSNLLSYGRSLLNFANSEDAGHPLKVGLFVQKCK